MTAAKINYRSVFIIRVGLALVFLANSYIAFTSSEEFVVLIGKSFLAGILPINLDLFVKFIGASDAIVASLLFLGIELRFVSIYATIWLLGVVTVIGLSDPGDLLEHFGFLSMAIYLILNSKKVNTSS